jgi:hypothetical protein
MKVCIYVDENRGYVHYNPFTHKVMVTNPVDKIRWAVYRYLTTKRNFDMPDGGREGSKEMIEAVPTDSTGLLELALCEMFHTIKVHVDWGDPNNTGGYEAESVGADDTSPDKPIIKSLDGIEEYQIIN